MEQFEDFKFVVEQQNIVEEENKRVWKDGSIPFSPRIVYQGLEGIRMDIEQSKWEGFPAGKIWLGQVPSKVCLFLWALARERTLTIDNLKKRGRSMPSRCIMCEQEEESISHLFINCVEQTTRWLRFAIPRYLEY